MIIPGHNMKKFWGIVYSMIDNSDVALQVVDIRFPSICRSNQLEKYVEKHENSNLLLALNKADLVSKEYGNAWVKWFSKQKINAIAISAKKRLGTTRLRKRILMASKKKTAIVSVIGLPNTGKSSVINALKGKQVAAVAPIPGKTRGEQKIKVSNSLRMFDTPGIVPRMLPEAHNILLGLTPINKLKDVDLVALKFYELAEEINPGKIAEYYEIEVVDDILEAIAFKRNKIIKGNKPNLIEAGRILLKDHMAGSYVIKEGIGDPLRLQKKL